MLRPAYIGVTLMTAVALWPAGVEEVQAQARGGEWELEARVWLDRGVEPVLQMGDPVRVYYRVTEPAYLTILHIDTSGQLTLVHPRHPEEAQPARGRADYRLLFPEGNRWIVDEEPGVGYFFAVASEVPFDFSLLSYRGEAEGWDLTPVGQVVHQDPFVAVDEFVAAVLPEWEEVAYALDFAQYRVGRAYSYPRFLCYDCHVAEPYTAWNPYHFTCSSVRIVIYNDPYFYPATRYRGNRVVYTRPPEAHLAQFTFKERAQGEPGTPVVQTRGAVGRDAGAPVGVPLETWTGAGTERTVPSGAAGSRGVSEAPPGGAPDRRLPAAAPDDSPGDPGTARDASARSLPSTPEGRGRAIPQGTDAGQGRRPVLERRPPEVQGDAPGAGRRTPVAPGSHFSPRILPSPDEGAGRTPAPRRFLPAPGPRPGATPTPPSVRRPPQSEPEPERRRPAVRRPSGGS